MGSDGYATALAIWKRAQDLRDGIVALDMAAGDSTAAYIQGLVMAILEHVEEYDGLAERVRRLETALVEIQERDARFRERLPSPP